jgi:hypothetical protein
LEEYPCPYTCRDKTGRNQNQKVKTMSNKLTALHAGQVLGRSETKKIMAGSSDGFQQVAKHTGLILKVILSELPVTPMIHEKLSFTSIQYNIRDIVSLNFVRFLIGT